jgi:hypothetical protein
VREVVRPVAHETSRGSHSGDRFSPGNGPQRRSDRQLRADIDRALSDRPEVVCGCRAGNYF